MAGNGKSKSKQPIDAPRTSVFWVDPNDIVVVGLDTSDGPEHPLWDSRAFLPLEEEFVLNILQHGVVSTLTARVVDGQTYVVEGRRRVTHAREALKRQVRDGVPESELLRIPVRTVRGDDGHLLSLSRVANSFRREETILEKAHHAQRMLALGRTEYDIGVTYGANETTVKSWLSLLDADKALRKAIIEGRVAASAAYRLARLPHADQRAALEELLASGHTSVREARRVTAKSRGRGDTVGAPRKTLRGLRDLLRSSDATDDFQRGVAAALDLVLGTETQALDERLVRWTEEVSRRPRRALPANDETGDAADGEVSTDDDEGPKAANDEMTIEEAREAHS